MQLWKCPYCLYGSDINLCKDVSAMRNHQSCYHFQPAGHSDCSQCVYRSRTENYMMTYFCQAKGHDIDICEQKYCTDIAIKV